MTLTVFGRAAFCAPAILAFAVPAGCGEAEAPKAETIAPVAVADAPPRPEPVNGWVELPSTDAVARVQPAKWRTDVIDIPVPANGGDLEYKLALKKGDAVVYSISYGALEHPGMAVVEFHGHTPKGPDGVGDLMFYSKTGGSTEHGQMIAPFEGIHGWYLKNDSAKDIVVRLEVAGFYELIPAT